MTLRSLPFALVLAGFALAFSVSAHAQQPGHTFISFETDCFGNATPGDFSIIGYKEVDSGLFAPCGVASITSGGVFGKQQLYRGNLAGMHGDVALAGAFTLGGGIVNFEDIEIVFSPPVNEVAFDALELGNKTGLTINLYDVNGTQLGSFNPTADSQEKLHFSYTSSVPIVRVVAVYQPNLFDGWFIDSLSFNAWQCGDGFLELDAGEECDDGNNVDCDGCGNDCRITVDGCKADNGCVPVGVLPGSGGCAVCDISTRTNADVNYKILAAATACDDGLFCTVDEACDGTGKCVGQARDCSDDFECTIDVCDEDADACKNDVGSGCLIDGACHATRDRNPNAPCEACDPSVSKTSWTLLTNGETCGDPSCSAGVLTPAPTCDAEGECVTHEPVDCGGAACADSLSCVEECKEDRDCLEENQCVNGACVPDGQKGDPCTRDTQCDTGYCADGVCCNRACDGTCERCNSDERRGTCTPVDVGTDPDDECPGEGVCSAEQTCISYEVRGNGLCALPAAPAKPASTSFRTELLVALSMLAWGLRRRAVKGGRRPRA